MTLGEMKETETKKQCPNPPPQPGFWGGGGGGRNSPSYLEGSAISNCPGQKLPRRVPTAQLLGILGRAR